MKIVLFIIFWLIGGLIAVLCSKRVKEYKHYEHPKFFLASGIFLCITMSWVMIELLLINNEFVVPLWLYHNCYEHSTVSFEDVYLDKDGNKTDSKDYHTHKVYRIYTCQVCGKVIKEEI